MQFGMKNNLFYTFQNFIVVKGTIMKANYYIKIKSYNLYNISTCSIIKHYVNIV